jgi:hypothetical protein
VSDDDLRSLLLQLTPSAREHLRNVLIRDFHDRNEMSSILMRYRDERGDDWADIIDFLTMHPDARRQVVRMLAEIQSAEELTIVADGFRVGDRIERVGEDDEPFAPTSENERRQAWTTMS